MKNINWKKILSLALWIQGIVFLCLVLGFVNKEEDALPFHSLKIETDNKKSGQYFVEPEDVRAQLDMKAMKIIGEPAGSINTRLIEKLLNNDPFILNSEVYMSIDGELTIQVTQRTPVMRIITSSGDQFYLDESGAKIPLSDKYSARVPVANGNIPGTYLTSLCRPIFENEDTSLAQKHTLLDSLLFLVNHIRRNDFMLAQTEEIFVNEDHEFEIIPKVGKQLLVLGDISELDEKFSKLILFYKKTSGNLEWNNFSTLNLKYEGQIVCVRNPEFPPTLIKNPINQ